MVKEAVDHLTDQKLHECIEIEMVYIHDEINYAGRHDRKRAIKPEKHGNRLHQPWSSVIWTILRNIDQNSPE